ncbi:MAG: DUF3333 domain-containing protein, partial [Methylococcus sp.]
MNNEASEPNEHHRVVDQVIAGLPRRRRAEKRFRAYGLISIIMGLLFLVILFSSIISKGYTAFLYTNVALDITYDAEKIDPEGTRRADSLANGDYDALWKASLFRLFPEVTDRQKKRTLSAFMGSSAGQRLRERVLNKPALIGSTETLWLPVDDNID